MMLDPVTLMIAISHHSPVTLIREVKRHVNSGLSRKCVPASWAGSSQHQLLEPRSLPCGLLAADLFPVLWTIPSSTPQLPKPRRNMKGRGFPRLPGLNREVTVWMVTVALSKEKPGVLISFLLL